MILSTFATLLVVFTLVGGVSELLAFVALSDVLRLIIRGGIFPVTQEDSVFDYLVFCFKIGASDFDLPDWISGGTAVHSKGVESSFGFDFIIGN